MQVPVRLVTLLRPQVQPAVLFSVGAATFVLSASPLLVDAVAGHYEVGLGVSALLSTCQLAGFGLAAFGSGRVLAGRRRVFVAAGLVLVAANLASALLPPLPLLLLARFVAGSAMGVASWIAWALVFGDQRGTSDVAMVGPLLGIVAGPVIAPVLAAGGITGTYLLLSAVAVVPLVVGWRLEEPATPDAGVAERHPPVPAALAIMAGLALFTMGGSAVWMFTTVIGVDRGLSVQTIAWAYGANAAAGVIGSKWTARRGPAGVWVAATGLAALALCLIEVGWFQLVLMVLWGFLFWMGIPEAFTLLAQRSNYPEERAGDAQALMSAGRVAGPLLGGLALDNGGTTLLGWIAAVLMIGAGLAMVVAARPHAVGAGRSIVG